jgi:hypothetical protein
VSLEVVTTREHVQVATPVCEDQTKSGMGHGSTAPLVSSRGDWSVVVAELRRWPSVIRRISGGTEQSDNQGQVNT